MNLTIRGMSVLVVGGGAVGLRKAEQTASEGAIVLVIDPRPIPPRFPPHVTIRREAFAPHQLDGVRLAFACAPPPVNAAVVAAAKARGVWVCSASDPAAGDFTLPSVVRRGDLTFAVSTGGASPALARQVGRQLLDHYDDAYGEWVRVLGVVRKEVLAGVPDPAARRRLLEQFARPEWLDRLRTAGPDATLAEMLGRIGRPGV